MLQIISSGFIEQEGSIPVLVSLYPSFDSALMALEYKING